LQKIKQGKKIINFKVSVKGKKKVCLIKIIRRSLTDFLKAAYSDVYLFAI